MNYQETCHHCGHVQTAYTLPLNKPLVHAFEKFAERFLRNGGKGIKKGELGLTNSQYGNFQNLRHFGIITQYGETGGQWYLTEKGEMFYYGEVPLQIPVMHLGGKTLSPDHPAWSDYHGKAKNLFIHEIDACFYKQRPEYQREKNPQQHLFDPVL